MGHLVNPISYRLYNIRFWNSSWFNDKNFSIIIHKDFLIYKYISKFFKFNLNYFFSHILLTRFFGILKIDLFLYDYKIIDSFDKLKRKIKFNFLNLGKIKFINRFNKENSLNLKKKKLLKLNTSNNNINFVQYLINLHKYKVFNKLILNNNLLSYNRYFVFNNLIKISNTLKYKNIYNNLRYLKLKKKQLNLLKKNNYLLKNLNLNLDNYSIKLTTGRLEKKKKKNYIVNLRKLSLRWNLKNFFYKTNYFVNKNQSSYYDFIYNSEKILYYTFKSKLNYFFKLYNLDKKGYKIRRWKRKFLKKNKRKNFFNKLKFNLKNKKLFFKKRKLYKKFFWKSQLKKDFFLQKILIFNKKKFYNYIYNTNIISVNFYKNFNFSYFLNKNKFKYYPLNLKKNFLLNNYFLDNNFNFGNKLDLLNYKLNLYYNNFFFTKNFKNVPFNSFFNQLLIEKKKFNYTKKNYRYKIYNYNRFSYILSNNFKNTVFFNSLNLNQLKLNSYLKWNNLLKLKLKKINLLKSNKLKKLKKKKTVKFKLKNSLFILQKYLRYRKNFVVNNFILKQVNIVSLLKTISLKNLIYLILILKKSFYYFNSKISILKKSYFYLLFLNLNKLLLKKKVNILKKNIIKLNFFKKLNIKLIIKNLKLKYSSFFFYFFYKIYFLKNKKKKLKINLKKNYYFFQRLKKHEINILYKQLVKLENNKIILNFNIIREPTSSMVNLYLKRNLKKQSSLNQVIYPILRSIVYLYKNIIGIQINVSGRFTKKNRKSYLWYRFGNVKLGTQTSLIDYSKNFVILRFGIGGSKVWLYYKKPIKMLLQTSY